MIAVKMRESGGTETWSAHAARKKWNELRTQEDERVLVAGAHATSEDGHGSASNAQDEIAGIETSTDADEVDAMENLVDGAGQYGGVKEYD